MEAATDSPSIHRHKTAIRRAGLSLPVSCLLRDALLNADATLFDYGCGRGQDLELLQGMGYSCDGWDPAYQPERAKRQANVVNLGYVINVIEDTAERAEVLRAAWGLTADLLVVAAQLQFTSSEDGQATAYGDGFVTSRSTFQKYYTQSELRRYLEDTLAADAVPAAPGVFYVFKAEEARQQFIARRYRQQISVPRRRVSQVRFDENRDVLEPFMETVTRLGRLPGPDEFELYPTLAERFGSVKRAMALVNRVTGAEAWEAIATRRAEDLLVFLALSRFQLRPAFGLLPPSVQRDAKAFFGTYQNACRQADALLFQVGDAAAVEQACQRSPVGRLVDNALLLHQSALASAEPLLRIFEGCARALVGEVDGADVIKLHRHSGKVSYLVYDGFDADPQPALSLRVKVTLPSLAVEFFEYRDRASSPRLDSKAGLFAPDGAQIQDDPVQGE